jgi:hypothetical protein
VELFRFGGIVLVTVAMGAPAIPTSDASTDPCAKQVAAVHRARSRPSRRAAKEALALCRAMHAVSIVPANPHANETITVTIHPRWPLRKGCFYEAAISDEEGHPGFDHYLHAKWTRTRNPVLTLTAEGKEPFEGRVTEWAPGAAELHVIEGTPRQLDDVFHPKWREVGFLEFQFLPRS